jgi:hypothetical protein
MKLTQAFLVCLCVLGATDLAWSQVKEPAGRPIPGYLDPATGKFTTRIAHAATAQPDPAAGVSSTSVFFREDFQIYIANYDQKGTSAICSVDMTSYDDAGGTYDEVSSVFATAVGSGFSCDVPVLTLWTLQTPTTDMITATVTVTVYTPNSQTSPVLIYPGGYRSSTQSLTVAQPANGQTAVNSIKFSL